MDAQSRFFLQETKVAQSKKLLVRLYRFLPPIAQRKMILGTFSFS